MTDRCNEQVYNEGRAILVADVGDADHEFEEWVQGIAEASGQPVDWFYAGGRAVVKYIGSRDAVARAIAAYPCPARAFFSCGVHP